MYISKHKIRIVTAASLFDGHDVAVNVMRRIMQSSGAEVIHLGHNRSALEIVECAICEDVQAIAITSYQGGHIEFFKYIFDLLQERNCSHIKIFGGGGGTILPNEIADLQEYGITKIYAPDDGRTMGLQGMIDEVLAYSDFPTIHKDSFTFNTTNLSITNWKYLGQCITMAEQDYPFVHKLTKKNHKVTPVIGITGTGGSGKSSLTDELVMRYLRNYSDKSIAIISIDPSKKKTGGALLGDRIRMNAIFNKRCFMRSLATRSDNSAISNHINTIINLCKVAGFDIIIVETSGIGQSDAAIVDICDIPIYVMTPEYGSASQLEKINMLDYAKFIVINKFDKLGALDSLSDVRKQYKRNHNLFEKPNDELPIFSTISSQFNDFGVNLLFNAVLNYINTHFQTEYKIQIEEQNRNEYTIIPPQRQRYLAEIVETVTAYNQFTIKQADIATKLYQVEGTLAQLEKKEII